MILPFRFEYFLKDSYVSKNVSKNKANYKLMFLVHKEKIIEKLLKLKLKKIIQIVGNSL